MIERTAMTRAVLLFFVARALFSAVAERPKAPP
jgi:hypothetical protein